MGDKERQEDELEVLQSIYPREFTVKTKWPFSGILRISPSIMGDDFNINVMSKIGDEPDEKVLKVKHLPPIELYFRCPNDYPSFTPPYFMLSCIWMPDVQLTQICHHLDKLWETYKSEILFTWASFLKEDCCAFLNLQELQFTLDQEPVRFLVNGTPVPSTLDETDGVLKLDGSIYREYGAKTLNMKPLSDRNSDAPARKNLRLKYERRSKLRRRICNDDVVKYETPKDIEKKKNSAESSSVKILDQPVAQEADEQDCSSHSHRKEANIFKFLTMYGRRNKSKLSDEKDWRVVAKSDEKAHIVRVIEEYNDRILERQFRTENHSCEVCYEEKNGSYCVRMKPCEHVFCKNCVKDFLTLNILNGNMGALRCLQYECNSFFTDSQIKQNIDEDVYKKYRKFSLKFAVDSDPNLLYCPREICQSVASISDLSRDMCHCKTCGFYFCLYCKKAYHGVAVCDLKNEERKRVVGEYLTASPERKRVLEKRYTKQQLQKWVESDLTQKYLEKSSKPCPNCRALIQKVDGCNKMMCLNCNTPFCWLCNTCLSRSQPYKHFVDPSSTCYQQLFPPEEMVEHLEEGEFEDEVEDEDAYYAMFDEMLLNINDPGFEDLWQLYFFD